VGRAVEPLHRDKLSQRVATSWHAASFEAIDGIRVIPQSTTRILAVTTVVTGLVEVCTAKDRARQYKSTVMARFWLLNREHCFMLQCRKPSDTPSAGKPIFTVSCLSCTVKVHALDSTYAKSPQGVSEDIPEGFRSTRRHA